MIEERLKELGIILPEAPARGGNYTPVKYFQMIASYIVPDSAARRRIGR